MRTKKIPSYTEEELFSCPIIILLGEHPQPTRYRQVLLTSKEVNKLNTYIDKLIKSGTHDVMEFFALRGSSWTFSISSKEYPLLNESFTPDEIQKYKYKKEESPDD